MSLAAVDSVLVSYFGWILYKSGQHGGSVFRGLGLFGVFLLETKLLVGVKMRADVFFHVSSPRDRL